MEEQLSLEFLRVVENGAVAAARTMGFGDRHKADEMAVEAMRKTLDAVQMDGTIVIGEGERDEAPMLFIGEKVGLATHAPKALFPEVDIAVDPLEGTNLCATGAANAIAVLAASERGGLLHAPDIYMDKIVVGPESKGATELDAPVADNLKSIAGLKTTVEGNPQLIPAPKITAAKTIKPPASNLGLSEAESATGLSAIFSQCRSIRRA